MFSSRYPFFVITTALLFGIVGAPRGVGAAPITFFTAAAAYNPCVPSGTLDFHDTGSPSTASQGCIPAQANSYSDLSTGELRAFSHATKGDSAGIADFGDSFRTYSDTAPFSWSGETATFSFDISGFVDLIGGTNSIGDFGVNGGALNSSEFVLYIFEPGALDAYARWINGEPTFSDWSNRVILKNRYVLGPGPTYGDTTEYLTTYPTTVTASFTPGSDFDWAVSLRAWIYTGGPALVHEGTADFSHTLGVSYTAPAGATTTSASGLFPDTLPLGATAVPEPATLGLMSLGLAGVAAIRRRR